MLSKQDMSKRAQIGFFSLEDLVPQDHLLRQIDQCIDFSFIYELVKEKYDEIQGRPSLDPILLIKLPMIQYLFGIKSMRQTIKEIEVNIAYRWFLGLSLEDPVPHFSTFGKNYTRRFKGTDLFEKIFYEILEQCIAEGIVDTSEVFIDSTHIKAHAKGVIASLSHSTAQSPSAPLPKPVVQRGLCEALSVRLSRFKTVLV
ncbi:hypothetical protein IGK61_003529 [Enterococcus sp. AZ063]